jgi:hypothetical protein
LKNTSPIHGEWIVDFKASNDALSLCGFEKREGKLLVSGDEFAFEFIDAADKKIKIIGKIENGKASKWVEVSLKDPISRGVMAASGRFSLNFEKQSVIGKFFANSPSPFASASGSCVAAFELKEVPATRMAKAEAEAKVKADVKTISAERRVALVIGNGAYPNVGELPNPPNDAKLMPKTLRSLNFEVIERVDADQKDMKRAIKLFGEKLEEAGKDAVGLFYFAGHGVQVGGSNYLIPVNVDIEDESDVDIEAVSANTVQQQMAYAGNRLNMIVMDACRNNPFKRGFRSASRGLARMDATKGTLIAYATSPGDVAADGNGKNSPYTEALSQALLTTGLTVERVFKEVRNSVVAATNNRQVPWEASSLTGGDYYFKAPAVLDAVATPAVIPPSTTSNEVLVWNSIKDSKNPLMFEGYLKQYPSGIFSTIAKLQLQALKAK